MDDHGINAFDYETGQIEDLVEAMRNCVKVSQGIAKQMTEI